MYRLKPLNSRLSRQFFLLLLSILLATFVFIYWFSVPLIKQTVFEIERNASRTALNNVFELATRMYANVEDYQAQTLKSHQQQLKVAVSVTESYLVGVHQAIEQQPNTREQALTQAYETIRSFSYGNKDYIWIADYQGKMLSHPDPRFHGQNMQATVDEAGNPIVPNLVRFAIRDGAGFYEYQWQRPAGAQALDKYSYVKNYPEWGLVIGAGVFLDDLEKEIQQRKDRAINELRKALQEIKVAKTGYLFIFDAHNQMLIHPNANIDRTDIAELINPLSQNKIADDLKRVADTGSELHYLWDKPDDPGNYVYEKLSLVRHLQGFDWYICSTVYLDELSSSSEKLSSRILTLAIVTLLAALGLAYFFVNRITRPLEQLAETARRVSSGDLSAKSGIQTADEVGVLAESFDGMVERLKENIDTLDTQVKQRTEELLETNARAQRMSAVGQLAGGLAHDFNNLLSIILGNLLLARDRYLGADGLDELLSPAIRASRRGADITHRLLSFARRQSLQTETVSIEQRIRETVELLSGSLPESIRLDYQANSPNTYIRVDLSLLENALVNLALNARDAMPQGGNLHFKTEVFQVTEAISSFDEPVKAGNYVAITISDTGTGFSEAAYQRAYEPFYTTKTGNTNSGLGLSMVYGFVKQSQGYIRIQSSTQGSEITLLLPTIASEVSSSNNLPAPMDSAEIIKQLAGKLLLVVDDNADVRAVIRSQLLGLGIHVLEAADAEEAVQLIQNVPSLDGLISDLMLPGTLDGKYIAAQLYQLKPSSLILLISGYSPAIDPEDTQSLDFPLLRKPFDQETLALALGRAAKGGATHESRKTGLCD
ncbi:MAG: cache domain-containing protein [Thiolinea sp.]